MEGRALLTTIQELRRGRIPARPIPILEETQFQSQMTYRVCIDLFFFGGGGKKVG